MPFPAAYDLRSLEVLIAVAEAGSMTAAAKRLGMGQSTVSQTIGQLEEAIGAPLFDRQVRPIALTSIGAALAGRARTVLAAANEGWRTAREAGQGRLDSLTLAMAESFADTVGPLLLSRHADIAAKWRIWSGISPDHENALQNRSVDVIVSASDALDDAEGLERHKILREPFVIVLPKTIKGKSSEKLPTESASDLSALELPFIRYSLRSAIGRQIERQINRLKLDLPFSVEFDSAPGQLSAVAAGLGWSLTTPMCLLHEAHRLNDLVIRPMPQGNFTRTFHLIARAGDLGHTPERLAKSCRTLLRDDVLKNLPPSLDWARGLCDVP